MTEDLKITRFYQRKENFLKALKLLSTQAQKEIKTDENIAALLHFYDMTFELAWKLLKDYLEVEGTIVQSPRGTIKTAFQQGLIAEGHVWLEMLEARNRIAHTYEEEMAKQLSKEIVEHYQQNFEELRALECLD